MDNYKVGDKCGFCSDCNGVIVFTVEMRDSSVKNPKRCHLCTMIALNKSIKLSIRNMAGYAAKHGTLDGFIERDTTGGGSGG